MLPDSESCCQTNQLQPSDLMKRKKKGEGSRKWAEGEYLMTAYNGWVASISSSCLSAANGVIHRPSLGVNLTITSRKPKQSAICSLDWSFPITGKRKRLIRVSYFLDFITSYSANRFFFSLIHFCSQRDADLWRKKRSGCVIEEKNYIYFSADLDQPQTISDKIFCFYSASHIFTPFTQFTQQ